MRIKSHPIVDVKSNKSVQFSFNGRDITGIEGEPISSALIANNIYIMGHHHKDGSAQGIFCVNGQCSQCMVIVDSKPVKSCMTPVREGINVQSCDDHPDFAPNYSDESFSEIKNIYTDVLIVGGGPSGINAAIELGTAGVDVILVDDKPALGGKLTLQTHSFFGSRDGCYAGTRGTDIADILENDLSKYESVKVMKNSIAVGCFSDQKIGVVTDNKEYALISCKILLIATGARERTTIFEGSDLVGVFGAGAFQTLVNKNLVKCSSKLFILGGGNVGLIAAYHAMQAGIEVVGLAEGACECGGYKVHKDKIKRLGVPVLTSHTIVKAEGDEHGKVKKVYVAEVDNNFKIIPDRPLKVFDVDTVLIAVGLLPVNELYADAVAFGIRTISVGDANKISEASAAIFGGKIAGREILQELGLQGAVPPDWAEFQEILQSRPGSTVARTHEDKEEQKFVPVLHCYQEIPCDPCTLNCPHGLITLNGSSIMDLPVYDRTESSKDCTGCAQCVLTCPGLAINLISKQTNHNHESVTLTVPYELSLDLIEQGDEVDCVGVEGEFICKAKITKIQNRKKYKRTLVSLDIPYEQRFNAVSFVPRLKSDFNSKKDINTCGSDKIPEKDDDIIICRCERVTKGEIRDQIRKGVRDMNSLKTVIRSGMGACGGKTCTDLILRIFAEEGVDLREVTTFSRRPLISEVSLGVFAGIEGEDE